ncbi:enolase C-terminal domain-like protein [Chelativorans salis]|uniref:Mandelate racemase n=1 Tax=Chelativorans salis TaxID=2978478 RepID=A0ABT2LRD5_9HYPH|nr:enolase C-terminal domain-like protein [Chelativorans sp. EGI FJ00035]MCT7377019.1 mandelate racemase [Chelativorans sp. EGI FJ00035]
MGTAPRIRLIAADAFERPVPFRFAFRFGAAEVTSAAQAFLRVRITDEAGREAVGWSAEMMMPKWFDKSPELTPAENTDQLKTSLQLAKDVMLTAGSDTAFGLHAAVEPAHHAACARADLNGLIASFGLALVDRAVIDALGRLEGAPAGKLVNDNRLGIDARTAPDLAGFDIDTFLAGLAVPQTIEVRHTVGLGDALETGDLATRLGDGLPETLEEVVAAYGHRYFKLKISGDVAADVTRLTRIAAVLDRLQSEYRATLDGNEQYEDEAHVLALLDAIEAEPKLARLRERILFLEQPIARAKALASPVAKLAARIAVEIDESDADIQSFVTAKDLGYTGISSKSCKGFYRALLNRARMAQWNAEAGADRYFMSAEDLTTQAGIGIQQDLVLAGLIGAGHIERNGHHFVDGMAGAPVTEAKAYLATHGDLYHEQNARTRLNIHDGRLSLVSLAGADGLGSAVEPDWAAMQPLSSA